MNCFRADGGAFSNIIINTVTKTPIPGKWTYNVNTVLAYNIITIAMSRCSLTQLGGHLMPGDLGFAPK